MDTLLIYSRPDLAPPAALEFKKCEVATMLDLEVIDGLNQSVHCQSSLHPKMTAHSNCDWTKSNKGQLKCAMRISFRRQKGAKICWVTRQFAQLGMPKVATGKYTFPMEKEQKSRFHHSMGRSYTYVCNLDWNPRCILACNGRHIIKDAMTVCFDVPIRQCGILKILEAYMNHMWHLLTLPVYAGVKI